MQSTLSRRRRQEAALATIHAELDHPSTAGDFWPCWGLIEKALADLFEADELRPAAGTPHAEAWHACFVAFDDLADAAERGEVAA